MVFICRKLSSIRRKITAIRQKRACIRQKCQSIRQKSTSIRQNQHSIRQPQIFATNLNNFSMRLLKNRLTKKQGKQFPCFLFYNIFVDFYSISLSERTIKTSHVAYRVMCSETLPIKKRSTTFKPVAPQTIKSTSFRLAISFGIFTLGEP